MSSTLPGSYSDSTTTPSVLPAAGPQVRTGAPVLPATLPLTPSRKAWVESLFVLWQHKVLILAITFVVTAAVGFYAFTKMPNIYRASSTILPARKVGGAMDQISSSIASSLKDLGMSRIGGGENSYSPVSLMTSREMMGKIVKKYNFQKIYESSTFEDAISDFSEHLSGDLTSEGNFTVQFEDTDPVRSANVTNDVVAAINQVNSELSIEEARYNRTFIEQRYQKNVTDLDSAERALGNFQRRYGVYSLPEQAKAELAAMAGLEQERSAAEIQLRNAEQLYGANSSEYALYRNTITGLSGKIAEMQTGLESRASSFVPVKNMPDVAISYLRLMREVEIQSKLKAFLLPTYEQAKLDENKQIMGFVVLDHAVTPTRKAKPKRSVILLMALTGSLVTASVTVLLVNSLRTSYKNFRRDTQRLGLS